MVNSKGLEVRPELSSRTLGRGHLLNVQGGSWHEPDFFLFYSRPSGRDKPGLQSLVTHSLGEAPRRTPRACAAQSLPPPGFLPAFSPPVTTGRAVFQPEPRLDCHLPDHSSWRFPSTTASQCHPKSSLL